MNHHNARHVDEMMRDAIERHEEEELQAAIAASVAEAGEAGSTPGGLNATGSASVSRPRHCCVPGHQRSLCAHAPLGSPGPTNPTNPTPPTQHPAHPRVSAPSISSDAPVEQDATAAATPPEAAAPGPTTARPQVAPREFVTTRLADRNSFNDRTAIAAHVVIVPSSGQGASAPGAATAATGTAVAATAAAAATSNASAATTTTADDCAVADEGAVAIAVVDTSPSTATADAPMASEAPQPVHAIAIPQVTTGVLGFMF